MDFFKSQDFMRLGNAIDKGNRTAAAMTIKRMKDEADELMLTDISRVLMQIRGFVLAGQKRQAQDAMAKLTVLRVRFLRNISG